MLYRILPWDLPVMIETEAAALSIHNQQIYTIYISSVSLSIFLFLCNFNIPKIKETHYNASFSVRNGFLAIIAHVLNGFFFSFPDFRASCNIKNEDLLKCRFLLCRKPIKFVETSRKHSCWAEMSYKWILINSVFMRRAFFIAFSGLHEIKNSLHKKITNWLWMVLLSK